MKKARIAVAIAAIAAMVTPAAAAQADQSIAEKLAKAVTADGMHRHLIAFQRIADRNGGDRADPTPGFVNSLNYVADKVKAAGFDVTIQKFNYDKTIIDAAVVTAGSVKVVPHHMFGSPATPAGGITGPIAVVPPDSNTGCEASDYAGVSAAGAVVMIRRGGCTFAQKEKIAADAGAIAAVVYNNSPGPMGGAVNPTGARIPAIGLVGTDGAKLVAMPGTLATVDVRDHIQSTVSQNLIAQTRTGRTDNVVVAGAHLDSIPGTPGINENASSVAALLEAAIQLGSTPKINNAVRFTWWGADWANTGSAAYLKTLTFEQQLDIALYLEFEAIGSPNGGYFVYDGDGSAGLGQGPYGSGQVEQAFVDHFGGRGIVSDPTNYPGRGAYSDFIEAGVPTGGLFSGLFTFKSQAQAAKWGGTADIPFDPNNHGPKDNLGNINRDLFEVNADAMCFVVGGYAMSTEDVNGVPSRAQRAAARAATRSVSTSAQGEQG